MARGRFRGRAWRETRSFYLFIAPWLVGFVLLSVVPLALGFATSLTNYDGFNLDNLKFRGLGNYARILEDDDVLYSFSRTLVYMEQPPTGVLNLFQFPATNLAPPKWIIATTGAFSLSPCGRGWIE